MFETGQNRRDGVSAKLQIHISASLILDVCEMRGRTKTAEFVYGNLLCHNKHIETNTQRKGALGTHYHKHKKKSYCQ